MDQSINVLYLIMDPIWGNGGKWINELPCRNAQEILHFIQIESVWSTWLGFTKLLLSFEVFKTLNVFKKILSKFVPLRHHIIFMSFGLIL